MPGVRNSKRAKRICNGAARGGEQHPNTACSQFVQIALVAAWAYLGHTAFGGHGRVAFTAEIDEALPLKRASVVAANVADTRGASWTQSCRHFHQA